MMEKNHRPTGLARVSEGKGHRRRDRQISKETRPSRLLMLSFGFGMVATASSRNANQEMVPLAVKELHLRMSNYAQVATGLASLVAAGTAQAVPLKIIPCEGVQLLKNCTCVCQTTCKLRQDWPALSLLAPPKQCP